MNVVVDASYIVRVLKNFDGDELVHQRLAFPRRVHAPHLIDAEVVSAVRGHLLAGKVSEGRAHEMVRDYQDLPITRHSMGAMQTRSIELAHNLTSYDAMYVVLAEALRCPLYTVDAKFAGSSGHAVQIWRPIDGSRDLTRVG